MEIKLRIKEALLERDISIYELHMLTGIRYATLYDICNNKNDGVNLMYLEKIRDTLDIQDMNELIYISNEM